MLTPENIVQMLDRYIELKAQAARLDRYVATNTPHDVAEFVAARYELPGLEAELLEAGIFKTSTNDVVSWARRKTGDHR